MWLTLTFRQCVKISSTCDMIYSLYFTTFYIFYHQNCLGYFVQGQFHSPTTQSFFWRQGIKLEVLLGFENFQIVTHDFWCQFLEKCRIFHFGQFLMYPKKKKIRVFCNSWVCYFWTHFQVDFQNINFLVYCNFPSIKLV